MTKKELNDLVYAYHDDSPLFCVCSSINAISYLSECMYLANYLFAAELHKSHCDATFKFLAKCFPTNVYLMIFQLTFDLKIFFI